MAAAGSALGRSSGFRPTRGLYLIFSLLCLVGLANSLVETDTLEKLKEALRKIEQKAESIREDYESQHSIFSEVMDENERYVNAMLAIMERAPPEMKPLKAVFEILKIFIDAAKTYMDGADVDIAAGLENIENKLGGMKGLLKLFEQFHDEF